MITISSPPCVDGGSLEEWLSTYVKEQLGVDEVYLLPDKPWDCTSQSSTFAALDVEVPMTKDTLISKIAPCSNKTHAYFFICDAMSAACGAGLFEKGYYHVYHKNAH